MNSVKLILIVEDDDNLRYLLTRQLKKLGYPAHYATSGKEAVSLVQEHRYDLILMDLMMAGMDGILATSEIRLFEQKQNRPRVPIIAMTAFHDKNKCLESDFDDYLFKPVMLDDLSTKLLRWLPPNGNGSNTKTAVSM